MAEEERGFTTRAMPPDLDLGGARPMSVPIYQTATYAFEDPDELAEVIRRGKDAGFVYTRWHNPTRAAMEHVVAGLERGEGAVSFSSGMAAIATVLSTIASKDDHVVATPRLYGGAHSLITKILPRWGIETTLAGSHRAGDLVDALRPGTVACYVETIGNPTVPVTDLDDLGRACRERGIRLVVDNTFASPFLCNPIAFGADVVIHSATKYLGGHYDLTSGVAVASRALVEEIREMSIDLGGVGNAFESWLILRGVQTLALRMDRHCATASVLADMLEAHPKVERVWYPGLASHPDHEVARRILRGYSGMMALELKGGFEAGRRFQEAVELASVGASLGGTRTIITHAASVTHTQLTRDERLAVGISDGLVRVSVGIEDARDILDDFDRALEKA
ncbi:MAG TPA: aminotransferase class I/II-fold pyridoxal phosphate-dependent enzyme [Actinomycetota bacterium]|jgi:methionine-gamma-lyase|nr:aminotransferase class I/II-fold pyridoxal phosphate-dependent enzyme [Actinomycetota bacterium]